MLRFNKKCKGAISVFLTLILLPTFIFGGVIVDGSRVLGAKNIVSGAGELAMNAALSNYNADLNEMYGLLAMAKTPEEVEDIMKDFFECTLNAAGVSEEDFSKALIYLELTDDFSAVSVPESEIYRTGVMRQEVIEYMKYRAPVTLVDRVVGDDRLEALKNIQKEKNAADGQIKFESEMEDVQKLFDKIKKETDKLEKYYDQIKDEGDQNNMLTYASKSYDDIAWMSVAYNSMETSAKVDGDTESLMREMISLGFDAATVNESDAENIIRMVMVQNGMSGKNHHDILEGLDPLSEEHQEKSRLIEEYESACENMVEGKNKLEEQLNDLVAAVYGDLSGQRVCAVAAEESCIVLVGEDGTGGLIEKLEKKFAKLQDEYTTWQNAVNELPEGSESRSAYEANIDEVDDFFQKDGGIAEFKNKIINSKTFYHEIWTQLDLVTFTEKRVDEEIDDKGDFIGLAPSDAVTSGEIISKGAQFKSNYVNTVIKLSVEKSDIDIESDEFVKLLKEKYCKPNDNADEDAANEAAANGDKELENCLKDLEECFTSSDVLEGEENPNIDTMGKSDLPSNWLGLRVVPTETENNNQPEITTGLSDKDDRKKVSDSGSKGLNTDNSSIESISTLPDLLSKADTTVEKPLSTVAKPLYMTEYVMGMFSYYTCDKDETGKPIDEPESLNGQSLKDNAAYRAEVEYILWGNPDIRDNVGMTKAIIFAANLVFNMSFVFTNAKLKGQALATASLFPVPVVGQTAIKCALQVAAAMVETVKNLMAICEGKAVPLIKTQNYWSTWIPTFTGAEPTTAEAVGGFTYEDYLWILVCVNMFIPPSQDEMLARTADCIELNLTDKKSDEDNTLKSMFTMVQVEASVSIDTYFIDRLNGAGYDVQKVDEETFKIPYTGIQGY